MTKLDSLIEVLSNRHVYIQTHNYPDPDALASAGGLQFLLSTRGIQSTICYKGHIDKFNTLQMIELLPIEIHPESEFELHDNDYLILVDCQKGNNNVKDLNGANVSCIDHHLLQDTSCYQFYDIRSSVGSCSTIIATYFLENGIPFTPHIATLLLYGLKMDTANFTRGTTDLDVDIFSALFKAADKNILAQLEASSINLSDLGAYAKAIEDLRVYHEVGFANIGNNCSEAIIGTLADFILSLSEVHFSMVYSYRAGGLKFSVRSDNPRYNSVMIIKSALRDYGDGGGHLRMAAGFIPISDTDMIPNIASIIENRVIELVSNQ